MEFLVLIGMGWNDNRESEINIIINSQNWKRYINLILERTSYWFGALNLE